MLFKRAIIDKIISNLENDYTLIITGARQTGKTSVLLFLKEHLENRLPVTYISLEDPYMLNLLNEHPQNLFEIIEKREKELVLIDEIQYLNNPTNFLKYHYDFNRTKIKIIATGSSAFYMDRKFKDSLAGRKRIFFLKPLNLIEFLYFKKINIPLEINEQKFLKYPLKYRETIYEILKEIMIFGSYPAVVLEHDINRKKDILLELADSYSKKDIIESGVNSFDEYFMFLKVIASQIGNLININEIAGTLRLSRYKIEKFFNLAEKCFHFFKLMPFYRNIRKELTKTPKIYFYDCGLRNAILRNFESILLREDRGALFENFVFNFLGDIFNYDDIRFWRTKGKNEVDFILSEKFAVECKFSNANLKTGKYRFFTEKYKMPLYFFIFKKSDLKTDQKENIIYFT